MIRDAEKFAEQDKLLKDKINAKNSLEHYLYTMRNTIEDKEKLADKIDPEDKKSIKEALDESQDWLNDHEDAEKEDFEEQLKTVQSVCDPIIKKLYQQHGQAGGDYEDEDEDHEDL